ncbi:MAG: protein kinase [Thermoanaerobaculia bacterium]
MTLSAGTRLGPYEILSPLGAGGMGEVYRARDSRLGREVAVKVLPDPIHASADALERFHREARAVAALSHPNILAIHDVGEADGVAYAVMELLEGETLRARLTASAIPARKTVEYALQIARGLAAAHDRGIVHRDLKPENVFLTREGLVKILDFGLASLSAAPAIRGDASQSPTAGTQPGIVLGTAGYMSPEQVRGRPLDHRTDLFALGAILFEMVTGRRAFRGDSPAETLVAVLQQDPMSEPSGAQIPSELARIVAHCLEKEPGERFQNARDLAFALEAWEGTSSSSPSGAAPGAAPPEASIAVLPFRNMSADRDAEYFSDGITEEIISALTGIERLRVAARTSSFAFKGKDTDVRQIGREIGVRAVLEGSVRQAGRRLRISAQLIDVANGYHLWSERYDREMEDIFAIQDEIAGAIAATLRVRLLPADGETRPGARSTDDVEAYDDYLKGRYFFNRRQPPEAIAEFERAIARDPRYTAAYTGLADSYCIFGFYGGIATLDAFARSRAAVEKAVELDADSADVRVSRALVEHYFGWDLEREEAELRRAIALAPESAAPRSWLSILVSFRGRPEEGLGHARDAAALEPLAANIQTNVGWALFAARRFEECIPEFRRALHMDPDAPYPLWASSLAYQKVGAHDKAVEVLEHAVRVTGRRQSHYIALLGGAYAAAGRRSDALLIRDELEVRARTEYVPPFHLVFLHMPLGDFDAAFDCLERAREERNCLVWWIGESPVYDPLRGDPRFAGVLSRIVPG